MPAWFDYGKDRNYTNKHRCYPCYAPIYADNNVDMAVYIPKFKAEGGQWQGRIHDPLADELIAAQAKRLSLMGFDFEYQSDGVMPPGKDYEGKTTKAAPAHVWVVDGKANSPLARLFLLNAIRQGHETPFQEIVLRMVEYIPDTLPPLVMFNRYLAIHHVAVPHLHNCIPYGVFLPHTEAEFDEFLNSDKMHYNCNTDMLQANADPRNLRKLLAEKKPWKDVLAEYEKLIGGKKAEL